MFIDRASPSEPKSQTVEPRTVEHEITSRIAFLLGVKQNIFEHSAVSVFDENIYWEFMNHKESRIIRNLCELRVIFETNYSQISKDLIYSMMNIHTQPLTKDVTKRLLDDGIEVFKANTRPDEYIVRINSFIKLKIDDCKSFFPEWIEWPYIKRLFITPNCEKADDAHKAFKKYLHNISVYPYQQYINWNFSEKDGNILCYDEKFLNLLYRQNGDKFESIENVRGEGTETKQNIYDFISTSNSTVALVDCENSDPIKFCAVLQSLNGESLSKISKIILVNDVNTSSAWKILNQYTNAAIEHTMTERVKTGKSLVDIVLVATCCKEHYQNNVDSFLLFSSDSDYWGLITTVPTARFLVMLESEKTSNSVIEKMETASIPYCFIDKFCRGGQSYQLRTDALREECKSFIEKRLDTFTVSEMVNVALMQTRIEMTSGEKRQFISNATKHLHLNISQDGSVRIVFDS